MYWRNAPGRYSGLLPKRPDDPDLVGPLSDGFERVRVANPGGVGVPRVAAPHRRHEDRQRHAGDQQIDVDLVVSEHLVHLAGVVADVERAEHVLGTG